MVDDRLYRLGNANAADALDETGAVERISDLRWRDFYQSIDLVFVWARVLRNETGRVYDARYLEVNPAWGKLVGMAPGEARGKTVRELTPDVGDEWIAEFARVVETHEPIHFTRRSGAFGRWYDGSAHWAGGEDFTLILHEVTDRIGNERRRDALLWLGDMLRDEDDIASMTRRAAEIIGTTLGASRAAFGWLHEHRLQVVFETGWALPGEPAIAGTYSFREHGQITDGLLRGELLVIPDIRADPRTRDHAAAWETLGTVSVVNVPVRDRGRTIAVFIAHDRKARRWSDDELGFLRNAADRLEIAIAQRQAEVRQDVVNAEIAHRLKNTLSLVQAIASQTLRQSGDGEALDEFMKRLQALGSAHDALMSGHWQATNMRAILSGAVANLAVADRCLIEGPDVAVGAPSALSVSLLTHELTTNALKYGALSCAGGDVTIRWRVVGDVDPMVVLDWVETGGPPAQQPSRRGFGSTLVRLGLIGRGGSTVVYDASGFRATFEARLEEVGRT